MADKKELRRHYRMLRASMSAAERAQHNAAIEERVLALPEIQQAQVIFSYYNTPAEVATVGVLEQLQGFGKALWVPSSDRASLPGHSAVEAHRFAHNPASQAVLPLPIVDIDLVIVPGVVWNVQGYRVGYGGGYFDRLLERLRPECAVVGLAFECQIAPQLPLDPWDQPVHTLVTEARTLRLRP